MANCEVCQNLRPSIISTLAPGKWTGLFISVADLKTSIATTSCDECSLIWDALACYKTTWEYDDLNQYIELKVAVGKQCQIFWRKDGIYLEVFSRKNESPNSSAMPDTIGQVKGVAEISSSDSCFQLASSWLKECIGAHAACRPEALQPLPTRVIDVSADGGKDPVLVETHGQLEKYVALSYCWGSRKFHAVLKTTAQNYEKHKECIELVSMPRTLRDAVTITRRLGLQYLWIDALCIIQGDADDWARESSKMCDVYSNSHLTIAGDNSPGNSSGILNNQAFGTPPKQVKYKEGTVVYIRNQLGREHDNFSNIGRGPNPEPINTRGWCLQEAMLSNRLLRYTSKELFWECNEWRHCECGHSSEAIDPDDEATNRSVRKPEIFGTLSLEELRQKWNEIVMSFTERQLGHDEDKFPALSGLSNQFSKVYSLATEEKDEYLAGHWRSNFVISLLWNVEDDRSRDTRDKEIEFRRPKMWRAPSWSWAAVEGPVMTPPLRRFRDCLEILSVSTALSTLDPYGMIKDGSSKLVVKGSIIHGFSIRSKEMQPGDTYEGYVEGKKYSIWRGNQSRTFIPDDSIDQMSPASIERHDRNVSCLLVGVVEIPGSAISREEFFLVLRKKDLPGDSIEYERIGVSLRRFLENQRENGEKANDDSLDGLFKAAGEETITIA